MSEKGWKSCTGNWKILTSRQVRFNGQHSKATHAPLQNHNQHMLWHGCNTSHTWSAAHYNSNTGYLQCVWILCNNYVHNRLCTKKQQMTGHRPAENIKCIQSISRIAHYISISIPCGCNGLLLVILAQLFNFIPRLLRAKTSKLHAYMLEIVFLLTEN